MLFAQSIKATLAKKFAGASFSLDQQSPIVPIRHMKFDFGWCIKKYAEKKQIEF